MSGEMPPRSVIYQGPDGAIELQGDGERETIWASLDQIASVFGRDKSVISRHIRNIFKDEELSRNGVVAFFATTGSDGKTYQVEYFNLDLIVSVGYRVNSKVATKFRQRATRTLHQHITQGYTIHKNYLSRNYMQFMRALDEVKHLTQGKPIPSADVLELVRFFGETWLSLHAFDEGKLDITHQTYRKVTLQAKELYDTLLDLKTELISLQQASELFARERCNGEFKGIFSSIFQSIDGRDAYPSIESKAAHLLYFIVKDHPFIDGNKRSGAFAFVRFLQKTGYNFLTKITPEALSALTLLVATSQPREKEHMIGLVILLLTGSSKL